MKGLSLKRLLWSDTEHQLPSCEAAAKSLRFGPGGRVTVCCHNNKVVVGNYPSQRLVEIWNSLTISHLRRDLKTQHFPDSCSYCILESKNTFSKVRSAALYDRYEPVAEQAVILDFKTDNRCNLACIMCNGLSSSSLRSAELPNTNVYHNSAFLDEIRQWAPKLRETRFSGGEPFLSDFYFDLWKMLIEINPECNIVVQTNGTILNNRIKTLMASGKFHINVSVDSFNDATYSAIRKGSSLSAVKSNLEWFQDYCLSNDRFWGMTACAMQKNCHEFAEIVNAWNSYNARGWFSNVWFPPSQALWKLGAAELENLKEQLEGRSFPESTEVERYNKDVFNLLKSTIDRMIEASFIHLHPKTGDLCGEADFLKCVIDVCEVNNDVQQQALKLKIESCLIGKSNFSYNKRSFLQIAQTASSALLAELFDVMDENALRETLNAFVFEKGGCA